MKRSLVSTRTLLWVFASLSLVSAQNIDHALRYRQIAPKGTGASASPTSALSIPAISEASKSIISSIPASDTPESSPATSNKPNPVSTSTSPPEEEEPSSTSTASDEPDAESSTAAIQSTTGVISSSQGPSITTGPAPAPAKPVSSIIVKTVVIVNGGTSITSTVRSTTVISPTSPASTPKGTPKLDGNEADPGSSGLKPSDRRIIIGTVVGIGGAILLGGIAVVVWRVWGKRKHVSDDDRDLMDSQPGSSGREKRSSVSGNDPFRSTLDQYHNPAGPVNTASNF